MSPTHLLSTPFALLLAIVCTATAAQPPQKVVYQWNASSFRTAPPYEASPVKRDSGATAQRITATRGEWNNYIFVPQGTLKGGQDYTAILQYEIVTPTIFPGTFYMFARSKSLGQHCDIWQTWLGDAGTSGVARLPLRLKPADDWVFYVGCKGAGAQIIDSFQIVEGTGLVYLPAETSPPAAAPATQPVATGASNFTLEPPAAKQGPVLLATDFGLVADQASPATPAVATANFAAIKRALDACRQQGAARLVFPKGVYRFHSNEAIPFNKLTDLVIDGQDSEFIFQKIHPGIAAITVMDCTRTEIRNLRLDWDWSVTPLASLCRVVSVAPDALSCDLVFPDLNEKEVELVRKAPWMAMIPMEADTFRVRSALRLPTAVSQLTPLPDGGLRASFKQPVALTAGETYCIRHQYYDMSAFRIGDSSHLLFENVTIYSMPGMGWVSRGEMNHWAFRNCRIVRREGSRRPLTATADGFHVTESLGNLLVENCEFTGLGDDCINIHDNCSQGVARNDDHTLTLLGNHRWRFKVAAGHTIELFNADYSPMGFKSRVDAVEYKGSDTILTLAETLPAKLSPQSIVFNQHYHSSNVRIVNCRFHDTAGRGVLTDASNLTIEGCVFDHTYGQGVQLAIDIVVPLWAEGMPASNVVLRQNRFDGVNGAGRVDSAAICTFTRWPAGSTAYPLYRNLLIEQNQFIHTSGPAISLRNCQGAVVRDNLFDASKAPAGASPLAAAILATYSSDLTLGANRWQLGSAPVKPGVFHDPQTTTNITAHGNTILPPATQP